MIRFQGEISDNAKKYIINRQRMATLIVCLIADIIIFSFVSLAFLGSGDEKNGWVIWAVALCLIFITLFSCFFQTKKGKTLLYPLEVEISDDGMITTKRREVEVFHAISDVRKVLDEGEWYQVCIAPLEVGNYLCQKDLLVEGSLEEFEKIFEGKIIRKGHATNA